ncbi:hypothetical protein GCM10022281_05250 [Sphingomonas rosea]|uniref:J domain-containing protein n=1 Tax=Sphingomonas rosea TaxID=335605 RepID=A0ABP7TNR5_9SPHN
MATRDRPLDYYEVLQVGRDASADELTAAYRARILAIRDVPGSGEETRRLNLAYRALSNPERRREYDASLDGGPRADPTEVEERPVETPPPPSPADEDHEALVAERPQRRRTGLMAFASVLALLLLVAGAWAAGLFGTDRQVAQRNDGSGQAGPPASTEVATADPQPNIYDKIVAALPDPVARQLKPEEAQAGTETAEVIPPVVRSTIPRETQSAAPSPRAAEPTSDAVEPSPPSDTATTTEEPTPDPTPAPPPPPPAPVDRSAGPRLLSGGLVDGDNQGGRFQGTVGVRLAIGANGRASSCRVVRTSGNGALDSTTCALLQQRLVFAPARDQNGNAVATEVESSHVWGRIPRRR